MQTCSMTRPFKTLHDRRLSYLMGLQSFYEGEGYPTRLNGRDNLLEVYQRGAEVPKAPEEVIIEKWID